MNNDLVFKVVRRTAIFSLLVIGVIAFVFKEPKPIVLGYVFGTLISILAFKLLDNTINKSVKMPPAKASSYATLHYFIRYFIYAIVLGVAALANYLNFPAAVLGLLMVKVVILTSTIFDKNFGK